MSRSSVSRKVKEAKEPIIDSKHNPEIPKNHEVEVHPNQTRIMEADSKGFDTKIERPHGVSQSYGGTDYSCRGSYTSSASI